MKLLLFSDVHTDADAARDLVSMSTGVDVAVGAGDFAVQRRGLGPVIEILSAMECPAVLVPGNGESDEELSDACADWPGAHVLHGSGTTLEGVDFWGLGGGVPVTPFGDWSFDLTEDRAREYLEDCPDGAVLVTHSPPLGHVDTSGGRHLGSRAVLEAIEGTGPRLVVCGHIHDSWRQESWVGPTRIVNAGPEGMIVEL